MNPNPEPEFARFLEWQLARELRRRARFGAPAPAPRRPRLLLTAAAALLGVLLGAASVVGSQTIARARERSLHLLRAELDVARAARRIEPLRAVVAAARRRVAAGAESTAADEGPRAALAAAERDLARAHLDLEEVQVTGAAPNSSLSAPLVGGRDFVAERLALERAAHLAARAAAVRRLERIRQLVQTGFAPTSEEADAALAAEAAGIPFARLEEMARLREQFLAGALTAAAVELRSGLAAADTRRDEIALLLARARERVARARLLHGAGVEGEGPLREAEAALQALEAEAQLVEVERELAIERLRR